MVREGYTSLSLKSEEYDRLFRDFTKLHKDISFTRWHTQLVQGAILKMDYLSKKYPNFQATILKDSMIIEDSKADKIVKVELKNGKVFCKDPNTDYLVYACLHPEFLTTP